jgi:sec-independent protein translocase protein TatC
MPRIEPAFGLYVKLMLVFGGIFQMPTLVLFLARMGVITARFLIRNMKYAILIMFILGAVLSPGTDPVGQVMMAGPMFILYLISIGFAWAFGKKKKPAIEEAS